MALPLSAHFMLHQSSQGLPAFDSRLAVIFDDSELVELERCWD